MMNLEQLTLFAEVSPAKTCPSPGWPAPPISGGQYAYESPRTATGVRNRSNRLKALGNCNPPQMYGPFLRAIKIMEEATHGYSV